MSVILEYVHHIRHVQTQKEVIIVLVWMDTRWIITHVLVSLTTFCPLEKIYISYTVFPCEYRLIEKKTFLICMQNCIALKH